MTKFKQKPENAQWLTPYLMVADMQETIAFYINALGLTLGEHMAGPDGVPVHAELRHKDKMIIMCAPQGAFGSTAKCPKSGGFEAPSSMYIFVDDVDGIYAQAKAAGATIASDPEDMFWGDRVFRLVDPSGYPIMIASHIGPENAPPPPQMG